MFQAMEGGHALLMSYHGYGRRTLTRLAAFAARYSVSPCHSETYLHVFGERGGRVIFLPGKNFVG